MLVYLVRKRGIGMKKILEEWKNFDKSISKVVSHGIHFSFIFCLFATLLLAIYQTVHIPNLFAIGISLFQTSLFFLVAFIAYGFVFNKIKNVSQF